MARVLKLNLTNGNIVNVRSNAYVLGVYDNVKPAGAALDVDALVDGRLLALLQSRMFGSRPGEVSILPIPRQGARADMVAFVGLGALSNFTPRLMELIGENVCRVLSAAGASSIATVPLGASSGEGVKGFVRYFLRGAARGLDADSDDHGISSIHICDLDAERLNEIAAELDLMKADGGLAALEVDVKVSRREIGRESYLRSAARARTLDPLYLHVSVRHSAENAHHFTYTLLTAGQASSVAAEQLVPVSKSAEVRDSLERAKVIDAVLGRMIADVYLPPAIAQIIEREVCASDGARSLVVIHDNIASTIPWESIHFGAHCPALIGGVSRRLSANVADASLERPSLLARTRPKMLMIIDPTEDLSAAGDEGRQLVQLLHSARVQVTTIKEKDATRDRLVKELETGDYDFVHFAGHADFEEGLPSDSGLLCSDGRLFANDVPRFAVPPRLIFLNACQSARMRRKKSTGAGGQPDGQSDVAGQILANVSFAEAIILRGVANFIGTYWPVNDRAALTFATTFYGKFLGGSALAEALRAARSSTQTANPADWSNYMHFGDPNYRLRGN